VPTLIIVALFFVQYIVFRRLSEQAAHRAGEKIQPSTP